MNLTKGLLLLSLLVTLLTCSCSIRVCGEFWEYDNIFSKNCTQNNQDTKNITETFRSWGFQAEDYYVTTEDGYIINIARGYKSGSGSQKPILLAHGMLNNGLSYMFNDKWSLAYILGNAGYDIWIVNFRGTMYSKKRIIQKNSTSSFWDFSFDQMGKYDIRSTLPLIHNKTNEKALYIGFSMGGQVGFIYSSLFPTEAQQYLAGLLNLSPVSYLHQMRSPVKYFAPFYRILGAILYPMGKGYLINVGTVLYYFCSHTTFLMYLCDTVTGIIQGFDYDQMNAMTYPLQHHYFDVINLGILLHYAQQINEESFTAYDYGKEKNLQVYRQTQPPVYNGSKILIPVKIFLGKNDHLVVEKDAKKFYSELQSKYQKGVEMVEFDNFNHLDVIRAKDTSTFLYEKILQSASSFF